MNKREDILTKLSKKYLANSDVETKEAIYLRKLIDELYDHYQFIDLEKGSDLAKIFEKLYINIDDTLYYNFAANFYISTDTLENYRKRFDSTILKVFERDGVTFNKNESILILKS